MKITDHLNINPDRLINWEMKYSRTTGGDPSIILDFGNRDEIELTDSEWGPGFAERTNAKIYAYFEGKEAAYLPILTSVSCYPPKEQIIKKTDAVIVYRNLGKKNAKN